MNYISITNSRLTDQFRLIFNFLSGVNFKLPKSFARMSTSKEIQNTRHDLIMTSLCRKCKKNRLYKAPPCRSSASVSVNWFFCRESSATQQRQHEPVYLYIYIQYIYLYQSTHCSNNGLAPAIMVRRNANYAYPSSRLHYDFFVAHFRSA